MEMVGEEMNGNDNELTEEREPIEPDALIPTWNVYSKIFIVLIEFMIFTRSTMRLYTNQESPLNDVTYQAVH